MTTSNATLAGAIKTVLEQGGLGVSVYRDVAPPRASLPFVVVTEGVSWIPLPSGDYDASNELVVREQVQVDVWQALRSATGTRIEVYDLGAQVVALLHNTRLPTWIHHVFGVRVLNKVSGLSDDSTLRRETVTAQVDRLFTT
jgi:hypothetical protein